jgi:vacuolar-type H+-ATPase subunit D/Vma8
MTSMSREMSRLESVANSSYVQLDVPLYFREVSALEHAIADTTALLEALKSAVQVQGTYQKMANEYFRFDEEQRRLNASYDYNDEEVA